MANLLLVIDPDPARRTQFVGRTESLLAPIDGLRTERCASGDFCASWAREPRSPISLFADPRSAAVVWGDAIGAGRIGRVEAASLIERWRDVHAADLFDGFHAAAVYDEGGLRAGADRLGLFPLYYWSSGDVVLVGSSAELFHHHPSFRRELSPAGLVGILLTGHSVDGQTLLAGVKRVAAGALLVCARGAQPAEIERCQLPVSRRYFNLPFSSQVDVLNDVLERAVAVHAPRRQRHTLLLSGGLDSRMLGGYLAQQGVDAEALTLGLPRDLDMVAARRVVRALRFPHRVGDTPFDQYLAYADRQSRWEHLSSGFSTIRLWGLPPLLRPLSSRVVAGYVTDAIVGGPLVHYLPQRDHRGLSFETVFGYYNRTAFHPDVLAKLLRREIFAGLVEHTIGRLRERYQSYSDIDAQRAWCFELHHRQRFQVGASAWRLSFGGWPVLPATDREVVQAAAGMPDATVARRRAQKALMVRWFPGLAALPLDRNSYDMRPLTPSLRWWLSNSMRRGTARIMRRVPAGWRREARYYYRVYDINNAGWRAVRMKAEPLRSRVLHLFEPNALESLLPSADTRIVAKDAIVDTSGVKLLLGLVLWSEDHL